MRRLLNCLKRTLTLLIFSSRRTFFPNCFCLFFTSSLLRPWVDDSKRLNVSSIDKEWKESASAKNAPFFSIRQSIQKKHIANYVIKNKFAWKSPSHHGLSSSNQRKFHHSPLSKLASMGKMHYFWAVFLIHFESICVFAKL